MKYQIRDYYTRKIMFQTYTYELARAYLTKHDLLLHRIRKGSNLQRWYAFGSY